MDSVFPMKLDNDWVQRKDQRGNAGRMLIRNIVSVPSHFTHGMFSSEIVGSAVF